MTDLAAAHKTYNIVRFHQRAGREIIKKGLSLEEVYAHCNDPETSSVTATSTMAVEYTQKHGPWFDGYEEEVT